MLLRRVEGGVVHGVLGERGLPGFEGARGGGGGSRKGREKMAF